MSEHRDDPRNPSHDRARPDPDDRDEADRDEAGRDDGDPGDPSGRRKERILHTRITQQLAEEIRRAAEDLRVPVSNLVRNVLEEAFQAVERVSGDVGGIVEEVLEEAGRARERFRRRAWRHRDHWHERERRREAGQDASDPRPPPAAPAAESGARRSFPGVVGWQPLVLDVERRCAADDRPIGRGDDAWVGLGEQGLTGFYLCAPCMAARRASGSAK